MSGSRAPSHLEQVEEGEPSVSPRAPAPLPATHSAEKAPVVKAKATHVIMSSLITSKPLHPRNRVKWGGGELSPCSQLPGALHARLPQCLSSASPAEASLKRREIDPALRIAVHSGHSRCSVATALPPPPPSVWPGASCLNCGSCSPSKRWGIWPAVGGRVR